MRTTDPGDAARIALLLAELRLPAIKQVWASLAAQADKEGWPAGRFLAALAEHEVAERGRRRLERHLAEVRLPPGKTLDTFDFEAVPVISKAQVMALATGDAWLSNGANLLLFGPPGGGKSHLAAALGFVLVENSWRVLFTRTTDLVQRLQIARRELALEAAIAKLDKFHLLILDDLAYVTKDQAETSVLFELISARYERRSLLITANQPFGEWGKIFPDQAMTVAAAILGSAVAASRAGYRGCARGSHCAKCSARRCARIARPRSTPRRRPPSAIAAPPPPRLAENHHRRPSPAARSMPISLRSSVRLPRFRSKYSQLHLSRPAPMTTQLPRSPT